MTQKKSTKYILYIIIALGILSGFYYSSDHVNNLLILFIPFLLVFSIILLVSSRRRKQKRKGMPSITEEKDTHYRQAGMDDNQIDFFRETMATAKTQIEELEQQMNDVAKLKAINLRNDTLKAAKGMFKELVKEPTKLHQADRFLYNHLPNLVDLTKKYIEINNHDIKTKNTYEALEKSAQVIDEVSKLLVSDYETFVSDDLEDLDIEMTIAKQNLSREQMTKADTSAMTDSDNEEDKKER